MRAAASEVGHMDWKPAREQSRISSSRIFSPRDNEYATPSGPVEPLPSITGAGITRPVEGDATVVRHARGGAEPRQLGPVGSPDPGSSDRIVRPRNRTDARGTIFGREHWGPGWTTSDELVNRGRTFAAGGHWEYLLYGPSDTSGSADSLGEQALRTSNRCAVAVEVFRIDSTRLAAAGVSLPLGEGEYIVVRRQTFHASLEEPATTWHPSAFLNGDSDDSDSFGEKLSEAIDEYLAEQLAQPVWTRSIDGWITPVCENMGAAAERLGELHDQLHDFVIGQPITQLTGLTPLGDIAAKIALPGDRLIADAKFAVEGAGIMLGLMFGHPLLLNACLKPLAYDLLVKTFSEGMRTSRSNTLERSHAWDNVPTDCACAPSLSEPGDVAIANLPQPDRRQGPPPGRQKSM